MTLPKSADEAMEMLYGEQAKETNGSITSPSLENLKKIENAVFGVLKQYGYERSKVIAIVANFTENLNRLSNK